ncbi:Uncharacterised protein [Streptococcus parasanguinis]|uniref:hypothetical protein n=1 Tax=Streptococcus parasanguinis TaxID=1318 RepID=UPI0019600977|nr:hypothetical protein [Streptococcus parasanguinis]VTY19262.1 Uncharacterised protein [Streptococcus parasanguinis]
MKRILDRFDNSPLWIRLVTVLSLSFILVAGLYTVKKNTAAQVTTEIQPSKKTGSLPVKKETKEEKEKKNTEAAEKAVVQMETNPSQDTVNAAQTAVKKVKDETQKQSLTARIQYIANYYGLTYEGDATATQQNQTDANANANANGGAGVATDPAQQQQSTPAVDGGAQAPAETAQQ